MNQYRFSCMHTKGQIALFAVALLLGFVAVSAYGSTDTAQVTVTVLSAPSSPILSSAISLTGPTKITPPRLTSGGSYTFSGLTVGSYSITGTAGGYRASSPPLSLSLFKGTNPAQSVTLTPLGSVFRWGDLNKDGFVGTMDASEMSQWVAPSSTKTFFSGYPIATYPNYARPNFPPAAAVHTAYGNSASLSTLDTQEILAFVVAPATYKFTADLLNPTGYGPDPANKTGGPPSGGYDLAKHANTEVNMSVEPPTQIVTPGSIVSFEIRLDVPYGMLGCYVELWLEDPDSIIMPDSVVPTPVSMGPGILDQYAANRQPDHTVVAFAGTDPAVGGGSFLHFDAQISPGAQPGRSVLLHLFNAQLNDGQIDVISQDGILYVNEVPPLAITEQPEDATLWAGRDYTFSVSSTGGWFPLTYQWKKDGVDIADATARDLAFSPLVGTETGVYTVTVTDDQGHSIDSDSATLTVSSTVPTLSVLGLVVLCALVLGGLYVRRNA